jgi:type IV pilus assembly protein PilY1
MKTFNTGAGSATTPSGLAQIAVFTDNSSKNNLATYTYGGDLLGNLWRFDINASSGTAPFKLATLAGPGNAPQPITTIPELGLINKQRVVFVGTGKYLEVADLSNTEVQTIYAIKDADLGTSLGNPRSSLVAQTISSNGSTRAVSNVPVDFNTGLGWRMDLPDVGERLNIDPLLVSGALLVPTIVPVSTSCSSGGYGWLNYINYKTGSALPTANGVLSEYLYTPAAGFNVVTGANGDRQVVVTLIDGTMKTLDRKITRAGARPTVFPMNPDGTYGRKSIWRELIR